MLTIGLESDGAAADRVEKEIFTDTRGGERVVLYDDERICGVCRYTLNDDTICIGRIGVRKADDEYADFFIRAILYKFSLYGLKIVISQYDKLFEKFGFIQDNGMMSAYGDEIEFPSECKGGKR